MINLSDEQWDILYKKVDETIKKSINDLPEPIRLAAENIECIVDRYAPVEGRCILGCYLNLTNGPIFIYIGQIFEHCNQNIESAMESVRQVYYHELAHAIGNLKEFEVRERGL